jgi:hypothetical protein
MEPTADPETDATALLRVLEAEVFAHAVGQMWAVGWQCCSMFLLRHSPEGEVVLGEHQKVLGSRSYQSGLVHLLRPSLAQTPRAAQAVP